MSAYIIVIGNNITSFYTYSNTSEDDSALFLNIIDSIRINNLKGLV